MNKLAKELLIKNNKREKAILDENKEIYENMIVYLRGSDLTNYDQEVVRQDIIELIIDGQQRGDDIKKVMGGSYKEICDEIIAVMSKKTKKETIMEFINTFVNGLCILGVIVLIQDLIINLISQKSEYEFTLTIGDIISAFVIIILANVIVWIFTKKIFNIDKDKKMIYSLITVFIFIIVFSLIIISNRYFKTIVLSIPSWTAAIIILFAVIIANTVAKRV